MQITPKPLNTNWWSWRSLICIATKHDLIEDFDGNTFCWFCWRNLPKLKAGISATEKVYGPAGKRRLERERKQGDADNA